MTNNKYKGNLILKNEGRENIFEKRKKGFEAEEVSNMDISFAKWLYSHLKMYEKTEGYKADNLQIFIPEVNPKTSYTLSEWIQMVLAACSQYLQDDEENEEYAIDLMRKAIYIWANIFPHCWVLKANASEDEMKKQREEYGFDEKEIYCLYLSYAKWMNSRMKAFDKVNDIKPEKQRFYIEGESLSMQDIIDYVIVDTAEYIDEYSKQQPEPQTDALIHVTESTEMWAETFTMFWC